MNPSFNEYNSDSAAEKTRLGDMYYFGKGVEKDYYKAFHLYEEADRLGNADATCRLGWMYKCGIVAEKDDNKAFSLFKSSAERGSAIGQFHLSSMYSQGRGVPEDRSQAFYWCQKAAEQGYDEAQESLGNKYKRGLGVKKNKSKAIEWYKKAAAQGNKDAIYALKQSRPWIVRIFSSDTKTTDQSKSYVSADSTISNTKLQNTPQNQKSSAVKAIETDIQLSMKTVKDIETNIDAEKKVMEKINKGLQECRRSNWDTLTTFHYNITSTTPEGGEKEFANQIENSRKRLEKLEEKKKDELQYLENLKRKLEE